MKFVLSRLVSAEARRSILRYIGGTRQISHASRTCHGKVTDQNHESGDDSACNFEALAVVDRAPKGSAQTRRVEGLR
jgi:hypothetical protein